MREAEPSRTALAVALRRAAHQIHDRPLVFDDPYAVSILGDAYAARLARTPSAQDEPPERRAWSRSLRAYLIVRSRYAEDALAARMAGPQPPVQYLVLGAGLDTFALRNSWQDLRVFEIDHPATQQWKRELLAAAGLQAVATMAAVDFDSGDSLSGALVAAGFDLCATTAVSWLGVVPYLGIAGFRATLQALSALPGGTTLVFDYAVTRGALSAEEQVQRDSLQARVTQAGEPFTLFFTPGEAACELAAAGFRCEEDLDSVALSDRYLRGRTDGLALKGNTGRMVCAVLKTPRNRAAVE